LLGALQQLVPLLASLLGPRLRVHADAIGVRTGLVEHPGSVGARLLEDALGLLVCGGEERGQPLGQPLVRIHGTGCHRRRRSTGSRTWSGLELRLADLLLEHLDLFGDLREIVADLVGVVAASHGRELTATDLGGAGQERNIDIGGHHEPPGRSGTIHLRGARGRCNDPRGGSSGLLRGERLTRTRLRPPPRA
jgi:hypothetical protein